MKAYNRFLTQKMRTGKAVAVQNPLKTVTSGNSCKALILLHIMNIIRHTSRSFFYKNTAKRTYCQTHLRK